MSGAEAAFVLEMIGSCWTILKICQTVGKRAQAFKKDYYQVPQQLRDLEVTLGLLGLVLQRINDRSKKSVLEASHRARLLPTLKHCNAALNELGALFKKHHLVEDIKSSPVKNFQRAIASVASESRTKSIRDEIQRYITSITAYSTAFLPTKEEIGKVVTKDMETMIDRKLAEWMIKLPQGQAHTGAGNPPVGNHDQSQGHNINAQTVNVTNIYTLGNGTTEGIVGGVSPRPSIDTMRTAPVRVNQFPASDGVAAYQFEPSIHGRSNTGPQPNHQYLHPDAHPHRSNSDASSRSRSSSQSSTRVPSIFSEEPRSPFPSPFSDAGEPFRQSIDDPILRVFAEVNYLLAQGEKHVPSPSSQNIAKANADAVQAFNRATVKLESISERRPDHALRKLRGLTHASLGLTKVTKFDERDRHIENAKRHNEAALAAATRCGEGLHADPEETRIALGKVKLDEAKVHARQARIAEKPSMAGRLVADPKAVTATAMRMEAFRKYQELAAAYEVGCSTAAEWNIHAQALLGCGQVVKMLQAGEGVQALHRWGCAKPAHYFNRAAQSIQAGNHVPGSSDDLKQDLQQTLSLISKSWNLPATELP